MFNAIKPIRVTGYICDCEAVIIFTKENHIKCIMRLFIIRLVIVEDFAVEPIIIRCLVHSLERNISEI